jgi:uncharacterized protein involved in exopolysaccharide biosynthesis
MNELDERAWESELSGFRIVRTITSSQRFILTIAIVTVTLAIGYLIGMIL